MPDERRRQPPQLPPLPRPIQRTDPLSRLAAKVDEVSKEWPDIKGLVLHGQGRLDDYQRRLVRLEAAVLPQGTRSGHYSSPPPSPKELARDFDLDLGPTGTYRLPEDIWNQVAGKMSDLTVLGQELSVRVEELEEQKRIAEERKREAEEIAERQSKRIAALLKILGFALAVLVALGGLVTWLATHISVHT